MADQKSGIGGMIVKAVAFVVFFGLGWWVASGGISSLTGSSKDGGEPAAPATSAALASSRTDVLTVKGMTCGGCVNRIQDELSKTPGIESAVVSLENEEAKIVVAPDGPSTEQIIQIIAGLGYEPSLPGSTPPEPEPEAPAHP